MRIGVDLDGVVYDFVTAFQDYLVAYEGFDITDIPYEVSWEMWETWPMSRVQFFAYFKRGVEAQEIWRSGYPMPGAKEGLEALRAAGHSIHIVTHRNGFPEGPESTGWWLVEHGIPFDTLTFAADKTTVPVDIFIEDNMDNYQAIKAAGMVAVLYDQPWNRSLTSATRVLDWPNFVEAVALRAVVEDYVEIDTGCTGNPDACPHVPSLPFDHNTQRGNLLAEADQIIHGDRNAAYGSPTQNFQDTADVWSVQLRHLLKDGARLKPADIAAMMIGLKLVRRVASDKYDNWLDMAGYAGCGWECLAEELAAKG